MHPATIDLVNAIRARDVTRLRSLIGSGANPADSSPTGRTLLHLAAEEGDAAIAAVLLDHGALLDARTTYSYPKPYLDLLKPT
jgi:ankyrin repeat protein